MTTLPILKSFCQDKSKLALSKKNLFWMKNQKWQKILICKFKNPKNGKISKKKLKFGNLCIVEFSNPNFLSFLFFYPKKLFSLEPIFFCITKKSFRITQYPCPPLLEKTSGEGRGIRRRSKNWTKRKGLPREKKFSEGRIIRRRRKDWLKDASSTNVKSISRQ